MRDRTPPTLKSCSLTLPLPFTDHGVTRAGIYRDQSIAGEHVKPFSPFCLPGTHWLPWRTWMWSPVDAAGGGEVDRT